MSASLFDRAWPQHHRSREIARSARVFFPPRRKNLSKTYFFQEGFFPWFFPPTGKKTYKHWTLMAPLVKLTTPDDPKCFVCSFEFRSSDTGQTESDAYEPTVHKHRCAQKRKLRLRSPPIWSPSFGENLDQNIWTFKNPTISKNLVTGAGPGWSPQTLQMAKV